LKRLRLWALWMTKEEEIDHVKSNFVIYNDYGYAVGQTGENDLAYKILKSVELVARVRIVLKLNIADVLEMQGENGN
jgi:hypothetical protein